MEAVLEPLIQSPKLDFYIRELSAVREREEVMRRRFRADAPEGEKIEFINGRIMYAMSVRNNHAMVTELLASLLSPFVRVHGLGRVGIEKCRIALTRNDYEPDVCFWRSEIANSFTPRQAEFPIPDFVVEILSDATAERDRTIKFDDYAAHGITEYWIIDPDTETLEQYALAPSSESNDAGNGTYQLVMKSTNGVVKSIAVQGFDIPIRALFDGAENLATMRRLLAA